MKKATDTVVVAMRLNQDQLDRLDAACNAQEIPANRATGALHYLMKALPQAGVPTPPAVVESFALAPTPTVTHPPKAAKPRNSRK